MEEKRIESRVNASMVIAFSSAGDFLFATVKNISSSGVFIETETLLSVDTELAMRLSLPSDLETLDIAGRVVWVKQASGEASAGMGIEFLKMSYDHKKKIHAFVEQQAGELEHARRCERFTESFN